MEVEKRIFRNTFVMTVGQGAVQLVNLCFVIYFARVFGAGTLGNYSFAMAIGALCSIFISLGTHSLAIKSISRNKEDEKRIIGSLIPFEILTGLTIFLAAYLILKVFPLNDQQQAMVLLIIAYNTLIKWTDLFCTRFQARENMNYVAYADVARQILRVSCGFILIWQLNDPVAAIGVFPICAFIVLIWMINATKKYYGEVPIIFSLNNFKELILKAWPYGSVILIGILYERLGILLLTIMQSEEVVGFFTSAERLVVAIGIIHTMFISSIFPAMMRLSAQDRLSMSVLAVRCMRLVVVFVLPAASLLFLFSREIIALLYGEEFKQSVNIMQIVAWILVFRGINSYLSMLTIAQDKQSFLSKIKFAALIFFIFIAIPFISFKSGVGLAYAILVSELFLCAMLVSSFRKVSYFSDLMLTIWRILLVCLVLIVMGFIFAHQTFLWRLTIFSFTFVVLVFMLGAIKYHDLKYFREILLSGHKN